MLVSKFLVWGKENDTKMEKTLSNNNYSFFICSWQYLFCHYQAEWEDKKCTAKKMDVVHWVFQLECRGWKIATNAPFLFQERGRMEISCQLRLRRIDFCPFFVAKFLACFFCILRCILWNHKPQDQFLMKGLLLVSLTDLMVDLFVMNRPAEWSQKYEVAYFFCRHFIQHSALRGWKPHLAEPRCAIYCQNIKVKHNMIIR